MTLSYDDAGNLAGYSDGVTSAQYDYNALGQKTWEKVNYPGGVSKEFSYTYYKNGLKKTFTAPDGTTYSYTYGLNNELREVQIPGLGAITVSDYQGQRPTRFAYPGNSQNAYVYDSLMRIGQFQTIDPAGNSVLDSSYQYDTLGNIETKETEHGVYDYDYDAMSRLTAADNPTLDDESYTYDAVGNRTTASGVTGSITHNQNNELRLYGDISYDYDDNGNLTEVRVGGQMVRRSVYNAVNRLV